MANIVLAGFVSKTVPEFERKLAGFGHTVSHQNLDGDVTISNEADVIFICGDDVRWLRYLSDSQAAYVHKPVVVVSEVADDSHWLRALEAGATDYCSFYIAIEHLRWIVDSATKRRTFRVAGVGSAAAA